MSYTCDRCGKEFETPIMVESGGVYGDMPHKEPASPCCEDSFTEIVEEEYTKCLGCGEDITQDTNESWCSHCI